MGVFGGKYQNRVGLSDESLALLERDFAQVAKVSPDLPDQLLRYVVDGEGQEALERLATAAQKQVPVPYLPGVLMPQPAAPEKAARAEFFVRPATDDPCFYLRLVRAYQAIWKHDRIPTPMSWPLMSEAPWLEPFLFEINTLRSIAETNGLPPLAGVTVPLLEQMLAADDKPADLLVRSLLAGYAQKHGGQVLEMLILPIPGLAESLQRHAALVIEWLDQAKGASRVGALRVLAAAKVSPHLFLKKLVELATCPAKTIRSEAAALVAKAPEAAIPLLQKLAAEGKSDQRYLAVKLLGRFMTPSVRDFLDQRREQESANKVLEAIDELLAEPPQASTEVSDDDFGLPPLPPVEVHAPLSEESYRAFRAALGEYTRQVQLWEQKHAIPTQHRFQPIAEGQIKHAFRLLEEMVTQGGKSESILRGRGYQNFEPLCAFVERPEIKLIHVIRLLVLLGFTSQAMSGRFFFGWWQHWLDRFRNTHDGQHGLREIAAVCKAIGLDDSMIGRSLLGSPGWFLHWEDEDVWPYFAERLSLLEETLEVKRPRRLASWERSWSRDNAFHVLRQFPRLPQSLLNTLWEIALGEAKTERPVAQALLGQSTDVKPKVVAALRSGKCACRAVAAEWLGRLRAAECIPELRAALAKEKHEAAKDAMMQALEVLGVSAAEFLDRDALAKEATQGLKKGIPKVLAWFPFDRLPPVHWEDTGQAVDPSIFRWFLVKADKLKKPDPGPLLCRYCGRMRPEEREALGQFVLEAWIAQDTVPSPPQEARNRAQRDAAQLISIMPSTTQAELAEQLYRQYCKTPAGSAISTKGLLAVAGACCGERGAASIGSYLNEWYGYRAAQCKALIATLASIEAPGAVQLLLSIANRFRTKGIREEAEKYVHVLAERKGWTIDQLADRTIPTGGLDDAGRLELDFGPRKFVARLDADLKLTVASADGKVLKAFPQAGKQDDEQKYGEAKKRFSAAKKQVKTTAAGQSDRLFEAMCTQRAWAFSEWDTYLNRHPIVRHLCRRLIWAVGERDQAKQTFRPMEDGSLTGRRDEEVRVGPDAVLRLAHDYNTPSDQAAHWIQHLADYEIRPLFAQFGRDLYTLPEAERDRTQIADFEGYMIEALRLRGRATKLGYSRGETGDGGWFYQYCRHLPGLSMEIRIEFSGNSLPEENRTVALKALRFLKRAGAEGPGRGPSMPLALKDVPPVLLSECYNDLRSIAESGSGFDPKWESKAE